MQVPFLDLKSVYDEVGAEIEAAVSRVISSGWYIGGEEVETFEESFARYCEADHCVGVGNGLDALRLALLALGVEAGDEVIVPSNTFVATWLAVTHCGAVPVPVEPDVKTFCMDPTAIEAAITDRTKVILPVHLYGYPADLDPILSIAQRHGLKVLEDAAQAQGARYKGRRIGGHSDAVAWSFFPAKNLGALGDAGGVTTNDADLAAKIRLLGNYGSRVKYENEIVGYNSRLDPIQAAALGVKLRHMDRWNRRRVELADRYRTALKDEDLTLPCSESWAESVWHLFVARTPARDAFQAHLHDKGVGTLIHYPIPPHLQRAYEDLNMSEGRFPLAEEMAEQVISLPLAPTMTDQEQDIVVSAVQSFRT
eukprot:s1_g1513.t1